MYLIDGEDIPLEMLTAGEARTVHHQDRALAARIDEVSAWLEQLAAEAAEEAKAEAAAEHAADLYADYLAGIL